MLTYGQDTEEAKQLCLLISMVLEKYEQVQKKYIRTRFLKREKYLDFPKILFLYTEKVLLV